MLNSIHLPARFARLVLSTLSALSVLTLTFVTAASVQADGDTPTCSDPHITCGLTVLDNTGVDGLYGIGARAINAAICRQPTP